MLFAGLEQLVVLLVATLVFAHPRLGKLAILDVGERFDPLEFVVTPEFNEMVSKYLDDARYDIKLDENRR